MYNTISELLALANDRGAALWQIILENEMQLSELTQEEVFHRLDSRYEVMLASASRALDQDLPTAGGLIQGIAHTQNAYTQSSGGLCGSFINLVMARALSCSEVNASMGKICAAPTAGACGILPAVLISLGEQLNLSRRKILEGMLTASGIGAIVMKNATVAGAEGGCQAECGVAAAMSAVAAVQMAGGSNETCLNAFSISLMNVMGLVCDPVAGLVQVPCAQRNASQAVNALISADLALAGMQSIIPPDEMVDSMYRVGRMLPMELKETAMGGIAATPTARGIFKRIFREGA